MRCSRFIGFWTYLANRHEDGRLTLEENAMTVSTVEIRNVAGTQAALGWADGHTVIIDRPVGRAGGMGLGFNGAQLLALTIGGCFANDLRYVAAGLDRPVGDITISVSVTLEGDPIRATAADMTVAVSMVDGSDPTELIERAKAVSMAMNSISRGLPVSARAV
jgi:organic hydroperoxide reductase OsmC/OhrA